MFLNTRSIDNPNPKYIPHPMYDKTLKENSDTIIIKGKSISRAKNISKNFKGLKSTRRSKAG